MEVLINRLFGGRFLNENLGHEIIDFFKTDDGKNYLYLVRDGMIGDNDRDINVLLLVESCPNEPNKLQIIAKATDLTTLQRTRGEGVGVVRREQERENLHEIKYGGVPLYKIFPNDKNNSWVTFKAASVLRPIHPLFITNDERLDNDPHVILINGDPTNQSQRLYLNLSNTDDLFVVINSEALWEKECYYSIVEDDIKIDTNIKSDQYPKMVEEFRRRINSNK